MEIPVIESGIARFQSPSLLLHLWTCAALFLAAAATFSSLIRRLKRVIIRFSRGRSVILQPPSATYCSDDDDYSDDDDDVVSCSSSSDEADDEQEGKDEYLSDFDEVQGQNGKSDQHYPWEELARDGSVVKLWGGLGLGLSRSNGSISLRDLNRDEILRSLLWGSTEIPAVHVYSPEAFVSAGEKGLKVWDARAPKAAAMAAWQAKGLGRLAGISGGNHEVYVGDDVGKLTVVDLRNVRTPLAETWLWSDGAVTSGGGGDGGGGAGLVSRWRNAARSLTQY